VIVIVDYGMGNLHSVRKAFASVGEDVAISSRPEDVARAERVILPGVGAFGDAMQRLEATGLAEACRAAARAGKPMLGICLGMQLMFDASEEDPGVPGLGIFSGTVRQIIAPGLKVPHMGWNALKVRSGGAGSLFTGLPENPFVYFVHSYHPVPVDPDLITATAEYGGEITAAVGRENVAAVQFHPEKSGAVGLKILDNFRRIAGGGKR